MSIKGPPKQTVSKYQAESVPVNVVALLIIVCLVENWTIQILIVTMLFVARLYTQHYLIFFLQFLRVMGSRKKVWIQSMFPCHCCQCKISPNFLKHAHLPLWVVKCQRELWNPCLSSALAPRDTDSAWGQTEFGISLSRSNTSSGATVQPPSQS